MDKPNMDGGEAAHSLMITPGISGIPVMFITGLVNERMLQKTGKSAAVTIWRSRLTEAHCLHCRKRSKSRTTKLRGAR